VRLGNVAVILLMGVVTYATRVGFIGVARQFEIHPLLRRSLEYVPVSILAALVFPVVLAPAGSLQLSAGNEYIWATIVTAVLALTTRRPWIAIVLGVVSLVVIRRLFGL
jgi:branched-subunit amino acid transport protein